MISTRRDRVKGFLNSRSKSHSVWPRLNRGATPPSISSQPSIGVNSAASDGPAPTGPPFTPRSAAAPSSRIAAGSRSPPAACADARPLYGASSNSAAMTILRRSMIPPSQIDNDDGRSYAP